MTLNEFGLQRCRETLLQASQLRLTVETNEHHTRLVDFGVKAMGGMQAGLALADVSLAGLGRTSTVMGDPQIWPGPAVSIVTDQPVAACMASQYAGWPIQIDEYFAMGSGPMRAARGREPLLDRIGYLEKPTEVVGVLESSRIPPVNACDLIAEECGVAPANLTLLFAPTSSLAGTVQVVSRSVETALHKMHELGYELQRVRSALGVAPLPPVASDALTGIGRTNDAILYGGQVTLWVADDDDQLQQIGPQIPSSSSADYGEPFARIFDRYDHDFYQIDPLLFSPATVTLINLESGKMFRFGETRSDVLKRSFLGG